MIAIVTLHIRMINVTLLLLISQKFIFIYLLMIVIMYSSVIWYVGFSSLYLNSAYNTSVYRIMDILWILILISTLICDSIIIDHRIKMMIFTLCDINLIRQLYNSVFENEVQVFTICLPLCFNWQHIMATFITQVLIFYCKFTANLFIRPNSSIFLNSQYLIINEFKE
jgi:hypothetical protein